MNHYNAPDYSLSVQGSGENPKKQWKPVPLLLLAVAYFAVMALSWYFSPWENVDVTAFAEARPDLAEGLIHPEIISFSYMARNPVEFGLWFICYGLADFATLIGYLWANEFATGSSYDYFTLIAVCFIPGFAAKVVNSYGRYRWNEYPAMQKFISGVLLQNIVFYFSSLLSFYLIPWMLPGIGDALSKSPLFAILVVIGSFLLVVSLVATEMYMLSICVVLFGADYLFKYIYASISMPDFVAYPLFFVLGVGAAILLELISDFWFDLETKISDSCCGCFTALMPSRWIDSLMGMIFKK